MATGCVVHPDDDVMAALERYRHRPETPTTGSSTIADLERRVIEATQRVEDLKTLTAPSYGSPNPFGAPLSYGGADPLDGPSAYRPYGMVGRYEPPQPEQPQTVEELRAERDRAAEAEQDAVQALRDIEAAMSPVAPMSATYDAARTECDRLRRLDTVFTTTITRLEMARAAVYHNVAADLEFHLRDWLGDVTGGRYTSVRIDPESLSVFIAGPDDPEVDAFEDSQGTSELVQLLLRLALFLRARGSERGPLILDDVLAHLDRERAAAVIGVLAKIARQKHQVILFTTHEPAAGGQTARLTGTRDEPDQAAEAPADH